MKFTTLLFTSILFLVLLVSSLSTRAQWIAQPSGTDNELKSVCFTTSDTGYAVGGLYYQDAGYLWNYKNVIIKTTNGGTNWTTVYNSWNGGNDDIILNSVFFINSSTGWAVGNCNLVNPLYWSTYPVIKKTTDGGLTWISQSSDPICNPLLSVHFVNDAVGYSVGKRGVIIKTTNGGTNWVTQNSGTVEDLNSVFFVSSNVGYCAGNNSKILKTTNGGTTWNILNAGISCSFRALKFADANVGYVAGDNGKIIKTTDGGATWSIQTTNMSYQFNSISLVSQDTLYVAGNSGSILRTVNGGNNWMTESSINTMNINSIFFITSTKGWFVGPTYQLNNISQGLIAKTTNGGVKQPAATTLTAKIFPNHARIWGEVHPNGLPTQVYFEYGTTNLYGNIIEVDNSPIYSWGECAANITGMQKYSTYHYRIKAVNSYGTVYGADMTFTYINGWTDQESGVSVDLNCVQFLNDSTGFIFGNNGIILKTTNYGANWILKNSNSSDNFSSCCFPTQDIGYSSTYSGLIYKTVNGGETWSMIKSFGYTIYDTYFPSSLIGIAVGASGKIFRTANGGSTWSTIASAVTSNLNSITFSRSQSNFGYIVGNNGRFFVTTNNGLNWTFKTTGTTTNLISVNSPFKTYYAFSVGENGISKNTYSYGDYFNNGNTGTTQKLISNYFINDTLGFAVGNSGIVIKTIDEGMNWSIQQINSTNNLNSVYFVNPNSGWAVGTNGTILHTSSGGCSGVEITSQPLSDLKCTGQNCTFSVIVAGQFVNYKWYKNNALIPNSNTSNYLISNISQSDSGSYFCVVNNECSSDTTIVVTLTVLESPMAYAGPDVSICIGSNTTLNATGGTEYSWSPAIGLSATNIYNPIANPTITTTYTVTVSVNNGCSSTDSVVVTVNSLGGVFSLSNPVNGIYVNTTPTFIWSSSSGATFYQLYIDGIKKKDNITGTTYTLQSSEALTQGMHTWYIMSNGCSHSNETWSMRVDITPPSVFNLLSPSDNSWTASTIPTFQWSPSLDAGSGLSKYQLWIDGTLNRDNISSSTTSTTSSTSLSNGNHSWMIKAIDNVGNIRNSNQTWTIKVDNLGPVFSNLVIYPTTNSYLSNNKPIFIWTKAIDAGIGFQKYQLFIDNTLIQDNLADTTFTLINPLFYGYHSWYLKAFDSLSNSRVTSTFVFYIDNVKPLPFNLFVPADSAIVDLPTPNMQWQFTADSTGGSGLRKYQLWLNNAIDRDSISVAQTDVTPSNALAQGAYNWFIKAIDNVGNARQSNNYDILPKYYTFSALAGSYNDISGTQLIGSNADNVVSSLTTIGFDFTYAGKTYTNYSLNSNGTIFLGELGNNSATNNLTSGSPRPIIAPLWDDLKTGSTGNISYLLSGTPGSKILTIQFKQMKWNLNSSSPVISFQVKLYESTNKLEFIYKKESGTPNSASASIGLTSIAAGSGNFLSLNSTGANPDINSQVETQNLSTCPSTGQVYRFEYISYSPASPNSRIFFVDYEPPSDFSLIEPADNSTIMNCRPTFRWHASHDAGTGVKRYELIISGQSIMILQPSDTLKTLDYDLPNGAYVWFVKAYDGANAFTSSEIFTLNLNVPSPLQAALPTGAEYVCQGATNLSYSTTGAPYASTYQWSIAPSGCGTITGSSTTAIVIYDASFSGIAQITVKGHNSQGYGPISLPLNVTVNQQPVVPAKPTGAIVVCQNTLGAIYTTAGSINATSYGWAVSPPNAGNITGSTTSATVNWNIAFAGGVKIKVKAINLCGQSAWSDSLAVTVNPLPGKPGKPGGPVSLCQNPTNTNYTTTGAPNTLLYNWHILPDSAGVITWDVVGSTATVDWNANFYGLAKIFIIGNNECGNGQVSDTLIVHVYSPLIGTGTITGTQEVCLSQQTIIYTVTPIIHAESYIWTLPTGASGTSTTNSIVVNFSSSATSGHITVKGQNYCGTGPVSSFYINMNQLPFTPENISGTSAVIQGQTAVPYTVPFIANATGYSWALPPGASIISGFNTNNIGVSFSPTALSGILRVNGTNLCGNGSFSDDFSITVNMANQLQLSNLILANGETTCFNALQTLTVAGGGATFIIQNGGNATMIAGQNINFLYGTAVQSGGHLLAHITSNNTFCGTQTNSFVNTMPEVIAGTPEIELNTNLFKVYPNPTPGLFTIEIVGEKSLQNGQIRISNILGKQLYKGTIPAAGKIEFSLENKPEGIYFITVLLDGQSSTTKLVKQ